MSGRRYLLGVLGLSAVPRVITFSFTLLSFPLMVRALGAAEYGIVVFIGAITQMLEAGADFGVSSAAGKNIAAARELRPAELRAEIRRWVRFQAVAALAGLIPLLGITYLVASRTATVRLSAILIVAVVLASWITIALNFVRAALTSLLQFRSLAILDTFESVLRSLTYVAVAFKFPTALGLATAGLLTVTVAGAAAIFLLHSAVNRVAPRGSGAEPEIRRRHMVREAASFLWLRLATRTYLAVPLVVMGRVFGTEVVGMIGAISRIVDMVNFPSAVVGNALAVRATGVITRGAQAVRALWSAAARFLVSSLLLALTAFLGAELFARILLDGSPRATTFVSILSITVTTTAISSLIVPMSDYVGALNARNVLLTSASIIQVPLIWLAATASGPLGAVGVLVGVQAAVTTGYLVIALRVYYPNGGFTLPTEVRQLLFAIVVAAAVSLAYRAFAGSAASTARVILPIAILWLTVLAGVVMQPAARHRFLTWSYFDFEAAEPERATRAAPRGVA